MPEYGLRQLSEILEVPTEVFELDAELPEDIVAGEHREGFQSRADLIVALARRDRLTVRELLGRLGGGRGHWTVVGTPEQVADELQTLVRDRRRGRLQRDGAAAPVVARALRRPRDPDPPRTRALPHEYTGTTLREHYGLPRPVSRYGLAEATTV